MIIEALAAGVPVITSRLGGMAELVEDGRTGLHFTMGDVDALAATLRTFVGDEALRSHLRANARTNGRRGVIDEMTELESLYRGLIAAKHGVGAPRANGALPSSEQPMQEVSHARGD